MSDKSVLIVAGGSGKRMGASIPKQFLILRSQPVLFHTIKRFYDYDSRINIVVVLPEQYIDMWNYLCLQHMFGIKHSVVAGGEERFYSVKNGLNSLSSTRLVAIHDGVRPVLGCEFIHRCFEQASLHMSAVPVVRPVESVRVSCPEGSKVVARDTVYLVQTPQTFNFKLICTAYDVSYNSAFTDDASVFEMSGNSVHLIDGEPYNIKITKGLDLQICDLLLSNL